LHLRRAAEQRDELAPPHVDFSRLEIIAPLESSRRPASEGSTALVHKQKLRVVNQ